MTVKQIVVLSDVVMDHFQQVMEHVAGVELDYVIVIRPKEAGGFTMGGNIEMEAAMEFVRAALAGAPKRIEDAEAEGQVWNPGAYEGSA